MTSPDTESTGPKFIKYTLFPGIVSERRITRKDLAAAGVPEEDLPESDLVFNRENRYMISAEGASPLVLEVLKDDGDFTLSDSASAPRQMDRGALGEEKAQAIGQSLATPASAGGATGTTVKGSAGSGAATRGRAGGSTA